MIFYQKPAEVIELMNYFGRQRIPFLFIIDYALSAPFVAPLNHIKGDDLLYYFNGITNQDVSRNATSNVYHFQKKVLAFEEYRQKFDYVVRQIKLGNSFLVNLSVITPITTDLDLESIFYQTQAKYKLWWRNQFVCFSPEIFVQVRGNRIASFPMKGTIEAHLPRAATQLLSNPKEAAEHATIVDLIRNDLSGVAYKVWLERYRYIDRIETHRGALLQVSSEIAGYLPDDWREHLGDWFFELLPAGSISGAPKPKTLEIIAQAEGYERGFYTGVAGIFDGENLDSGVLIRFIEQTPSGLVFKSGGGITARSEARAEYDEIINKIYLPLTHASLDVHRNNPSD
ncbi:MAG: aminodeoxychorismate synthase component I [Runella sp.]